METDGVDVLIGNFNDSFIKCLDKCVPIVTKEVTRPSTPWFKNDLSLAIQKRNDLCSKLKKRSNLSLQQQYDREKKTVKSKITVAKKEHYAIQLIDCRGNSSATWNVIKDIVPNKNLPCPETYEFEDISSKAEEFNRYFAV